MFAGVGGEVLYRPFNSSFQLGFSLHRVRQRDFDQRFSFREYETTTGHIGHYTMLAIMELNSRILIGKYLSWRQRCNFGSIKKI